MAVDSANIGANFSQYSGDPGLGGFGLTQGRVDTRALEDLAKYTMLYNKAEYDQRQKDAEKAAEELAKFSAIDLSTTIPKDAKILQQKFDSLSQYLRDNPDALNYKNREQWLEYNKRRNDLTNDIKFAKIRDILNVSRRNQIAEEPNEEKKKFLQEQLQADIDATDIRTPLQVAQKYDITLPEIADNKGMDVDVTKVGSNEIFQRDYNMFDMQEANRAAANYALGVSGVQQQQGTVTGKLKLLDMNENFWVKGKNLLNQAIANATDANGVVDKSKLAGVPIMNNIELYNEYVRRTRDDINNGIYRDKLGNRITFGQGPFRAEDYQEINFADGLDENELAKVAIFSKWAGDQSKTKVIQTNDELERQRLGAELQRIGLQREALHKSDNTQQLGADAVLAAIQNAINTGTRRSIQDVITTETTKKGKVIDSKSTVIPKGSVIEIADANLLNQYRSVDKEGNTSIPIDRFFYDPDKKTMSIIYFKKDGEGNTVMKDGAPVLREAVTISVDDWMANLVGNRFTGDDKGAVNNLVSQVIRRGYNYDLEDFAKKYGGTSPVINKGSSSSSSSSTTAPATSGAKKRVYKGLDKNGDPIFVEE